MPESWNKEQKGSIAVTNSQHTPSEQPGIAKPVAPKQLTLAVKSIDT